MAEPAIALFVAFTALLIAINFRLGVFVNDFTWYAKLRGIPIVEVPRAIQARLTNGFAEVIDLPVFLLATAVAVTVLFRRRGVAGVNLLFVLVAGVGLVPVVNVPALTSLGTVGAWLVIVCGIGLIGEDKALRYVLGGVAVFVFAVSQSYTVASALTCRAEASNAYTAIRECLVTERRPMGVDDIAARFVYSYRLYPTPTRGPIQTGPRCSGPARVKRVLPGLCGLLARARKHGAMP